MLQMGQTGQHMFALSICAVYALMALEAYHDRPPVRPYALAGCQRHARRTCCPITSDSTQTVTPGTLVFHPADSAIQYDWFTYVPESADPTERNFIWVTGLHGNLMTDDYARITAESREMAVRRSAMAEQHKLIMLVPVRRPDLKVSMMIDRFTKTLRDHGYDVDSRVFVNGFSAGGMFAQRYALLHPERVLAVAAGQCGGFMTLPEAFHGDTMIHEMDWPLGVHDLETLVGYGFNNEAYRSVAQFIFVGDQDTANSTVGRPGEVIRTQSQIDFLGGTFGDHDPARLENQVRYLIDREYDVTFRLYTGVGHRFTREMWEEMLSFFDRIREREMSLQGR
jgi:predicted esterase